MNNQNNPAPVSPRTFIATGTSRLPLPLSRLHPRRRTKKKPLESIAPIKVVFIQAHRVAPPPIPIPMPRVSPTPPASPKAANPHGKRNLPQSIGFHNRSRARPRNPKPNPLYEIEGTPGWDGTVGPKTLAFGHARVPVPLSLSLS
jgi:hypothetical protein